MKTLFHDIAFNISLSGIEDKTASVASSMQLAYLRDAEMGDWDSMIGGMIDVSMGLRSRQEMKGLRHRRKQRET